MGIAAAAEPGAQEKAGRINMVKTGIGCLLLLALIVVLGLIFQ